MHIIKLNDHKDYNCVCYYFQVAAQKFENIMIVKYSKLTDHDNTVHADIFKRRYDYYCRTVLLI